LLLFTFYLFLQKQKRGVQVLEAAGVGSYGDKVKHSEIISKLFSTNPGQAAEGSQTHAEFQTAGRGTRSLSNRRPRP